MSVINIYRNDFPEICNNRSLQSMNETVSSYEERQTVSNSIKKLSDINQWSMFMFNNTLTNRSTPSDPSLILLDNEAPRWPNHKPANHPFLIAHWSGLINQQAFTIFSL